jgi:hypothetical protein
VASRRISEHIRSNVVGYVALFIALSGVAYAGPLKPGKVKTKHIADAAVTEPKLADSAVTGAKLGPDSVSGANVVPDSLGGADIDESSLQGLGGGGGPPSGSAGGGLTGSYPNPDIGPNAVGGPEVGPDALGGADIDESSLGAVPSANDVSCSDCVADSEVSNTLTASDLVAGSSVVSDSEVNNNLTLTGATINDSVNSDSVIDATLKAPDLGHRASLTLDFPVTLNGSCSNLPISTTGAVGGAPVILGVPATAVVGGGEFYTAFVSAANTVTVRFCNLSGASANPPLDVFTVIAINF